MINFWNAVAIAGMILAAITYYREHFRVKDQRLPRAPLILYTSSPLPPPTRHQPPDLDAEANEWSDWYFGYCPRCKQMHAQNSSEGYTCIK